MRQEIEAQGAVYRYSLLERRSTSRSVPKSVQAKLMGGDGGDVVHVRCLHFADDAHFQYEDRWIYLVAVPDARAQDFSQFGPNEWLVRQIPYCDAEHTFLAANATQEEAALLHLEPRDALFVVERRTWLNGVPVTWVRLAHPGASFRLVSRS